MKKTALTLFALLLLSATGFAQGFYFRMELGYAFPQAGQTLDGTSTPYNGTYNYVNSFQQSYSLKNASFSSGFQGTLGFGYMFSEHVGVQLDASIGLNSTKYTFTEENIGTTIGSGNVSDIQQANTPLLLIPSLVLQTGGESPWNLYCRMGLALPLHTKITEDQVLSVPSQAIVQDATFQISNSFSLGFSAAAGVQYKVSDKVTIWGEVSLLSLSLFIKEADLKSASQNGYPIPIDSTGIPVKVKYSKNVTVDTNQTTQPTYSQPFSNVGINVGVIFTLSKHERHHGKKDDDIDETKPFRRR